MLLVSTTTVGERFDNARKAIDAAARAGVSQIVYTSILNASTAQMTLADAHRRTEDYLRDSGLPFVILRNGRYLENYTDQLPMITRYHALYAAAAAAVLTQDGHLGATYELGGTPFTLTDLAATISDVLGTHIAYQDMPAAEYAGALTAAGLPPEMSSSPPATRPDRFGARTGSNFPARSRGSCSGTGPAPVCTVLAMFPLRALPPAPPRPPRS